MRCYYRNDISCGANKREFEDQSVIKGKIKIKWDKTKSVSDLRDWEGFYMKSGEEDLRYGLLWVCMDCYGFVWIFEHLYGFVWHGFLDS